MGKVRPSLDTIGDLTPSLDDGNPLGKPFSFPSFGSSLLQDDDTIFDPIVTEQRMCRDFRSPSPMGHYRKKVNSRWGGATL